MTELKPGWQKVKFGDVVRLHKETCRDPQGAGIERVIGLEHLEPGDLRVRCWARVTDGTTFTSRVRTGQVLFGKRRAYQRKVAIADFEAVCSGDIYVLESADPGRLIPGLLPFICQTDKFFDYAIETSAGSLSPRTNWSSLKEYELALPPLHEQEKLVSEFECLERAHSSAQDAWRAGVEFLEVLNWNLCTGKQFRGSREPATGWDHARLPGIRSIPSGWTIARLLDVANLESGHTPSRAHPEYWNGGIPWISLADIKQLGRPGISRTSERISEQGLQNSSARLLPAGTVVLSRDASIGYASVMEAPMATSQHFANFICRDPLNPKYLYWLFTAMKEFFEYAAIGSTNVKTLYMPFFQSMQIALPPRPIQDEIVDWLQVVDESVNALAMRAAESRHLAAIARESRIGGKS